MTPAPPLPASVELAIYRVVQEALTNALRYAGQGRVLVEITYTPEYIVVFVDDDGPGACGTKPREPREGGGHGLLGMQERIAAVGGTLTAGPRTPGPGWRVRRSAGTGASASATGSPHGTSRGTRCR